MKSLNRRCALAFIAVVVAASGVGLWGCSGGGSSSKATGAEDVLGNMADSSYWRGRTQTPRASAAGDEVSMTQFAGRFVWVDYAAPWCGPCGPQAKVIRNLERSMAETCAFLTVMTSDMGGYGHPATEATAKTWANKHGLAPERVVAADLTAVTIPRHILYSPEGHMLFFHTGGMTEQQIRATIEERSSAWKTWKETGKLASWMRAGT